MSKRERGWGKREGEGKKERRERERRERMKGKERKGKGREGGDDKSWGLFYVQQLQNAENLCSSRVSL